MAQPKSTLTALEYLKLERRAGSKHEFLNGELFAMAGASRRHNLITANIVGELRAALRRGPCEVYPSDMRIKVSPTGLYTYPDASVVCEEPSFEDHELDTLLNPKLLVEVLSKSTSAYDLGKKFEHYRALHSVEEVIFADSESIHVMFYRRQIGKPEAFSTWMLSETRDLSARIHIPSLDVTLPLAEIYAKVRFEAQVG